jgi:hypothetical protein
MTDLDAPKAKEILRQMGRLCPDLDKAIGDDPIDVCRSAFEALRAQIGVTYWLVHDHQRQHFAQPFVPSSGTIPTDD